MNNHRIIVNTSIEAMQDEAPAETARLLAAAKEIAAKAYAPYSRFRVGAAILLDNGEIVTGSNQENAAYPSGLCAERVALFSANAHFPNSIVRRILIYAETDNGPVSSPITPCGACRQVLLEKESTQGVPMHVTLVGANDAYFIPGVAGSLVPLSFVPKSLEG